MQDKNTKMIKCDTLITSLSLSLSLSEIQKSQNLENLDVCVFCDFEKRIFHRQKLRVSHIATSSSLFFDNQNLIINGKNTQ